MSEHILSPSQINEYRVCPRKIAWRWVAGIKLPAGPGAEFGTRVHKKLETYLSSGLLDFSDDPDAQKVLEPALPHFPEPGQCEAEQEFESTLWGMKWRGRIDAKTPLTIYDLKTTKDRKYAKTPTELQGDPQGIVYSAAFDGLPGRWVYTLTRGRKTAWPVDFQPVSKGPLVDLLVDEATNIHKIIRDKTNPLKVLPNTDACGAFGGCPYRVHCTDISKFAGIEKKEIGMGMSELMARLGQSVEQPPPPVPDNGPVTARIPEDDEVIAINPPEQAEAGPPPIPEPEKPKRTRKKAPPVEPTVVAPAPSAASATVGNKAASTSEETPEPAKAEVKAPLGQAGTPLSIALLFIDCRPLGSAGENVRELSPFIAEVQDAMRKEKGIPDYRMIDFSQGAGMLVSGVIELLSRTEESKAGELILHMNSSLPEHRLMQTYLEARASQTFKGE